MPKGSSSRSGPAPDPNALRRDRDEGEWRLLPRSGRAGEPPSWPLSSPTGRELELWASEWCRPQAIMWERNGQALEVAIFVRSVALAEVPSAPVNARTLVRQQMDALGLTVPGLRANRWRIVDDSELATRPEARPHAPAARARSSKERLKIVQGGVAGA